MWLVDREGGRPFCMSLDSKVLAVSKGLARELPAPFRLGISLAWCASSAYGTLGLWPRSGRGVFLVGESQLFAAHQRSPGE